MSFSQTKVCAFSTCNSKIHELEEKLYHAELKLLKLAKVERETEGIGNIIQRLKHSIHQQINGAYNMTVNNSESKGSSKSQSNSNGTSSSSGSGPSKSKNNDQNMFLTELYGIQNDINDLCEIHDSGNFVCDDLKVMLQLFSTFIE